jgi:hypothetical protein
LFKESKKITYIKRIFTYLLFLTAFLSCKKENEFDCFKSTGTDITEVRYPGAFKYIEVYDKIDVTIVKGAEYKVEVTAGKHIIGNISTKITGDVLQLENNNKCNFVRGYKREIKIKITTPYVIKVTNDGVGDITFAESFQQDTLFIRAENSGDTYVNGTFGQVQTSSHGNGDIYFTGSAKSLLIYTNGTNYIRADNFVVSDYIFISTYSIGDAYLNVEGLGLLDYYIWDAGNIYYKGNAKAIRNLSEIEAKGKAIQKEW